MPNMKLGSKTYSDLSEFPPSALLGPIRAFEKITKGTAFTNGACRRIWCGTAGTLNFTDYDGNVHTNFPIQAGDNAIAAASVQSGGTADDLWAGY